MSREKQIEEMFNDVVEAEQRYHEYCLANICHACEYYGDGECDNHIRAEYLYNAGYRKQSRNTVELPCRIGDKAYSVLKLEDMDHPIIDVLTVTEVGQRYIFCSAYNPPRDDITEEIPVERIGVDIFLSRLDAEMALAKLKGVM